jgi:ATP-dependent RNA helicase DHX57
MPKNAHGPRGNNKKKAPVSAVQAPEDSLLIFTTDKPKPKKDDSKAKTDGAGGGGAGDKKKDCVSAVQAHEVAKKPDVRTIIGGASWTGKLPVNVLQEHCQKQRWAKPEYTMVGLHLLSISRAKINRSVE